jgi:hypothetical protein
VDQELRDDPVQLVSMLLQQALRFAVAFVGDPPNFLVDGVEQAVGNPRHPRIAFDGQHRQAADSLGHTPSPDHRSRDPRHHLEIGL